MNHYPWLNNPIAGLIRSHIKGIDESIINKIVDILSQSMTEISIEGGITELPYYTVVLQFPVWKTNATHLGEINWNQEQVETKIETKPTKPNLLESVSRFHLISSGEEL